MVRLLGLSACVLLILVVAPVTCMSVAGIAEGEEWLKWNDGTRLIYVSAYLAGFDRGFTQGCKMAEEVRPIPRSTGLPGENCMAREPGYPKNLEDYVELVTEYYRSYPTDRYVRIRTVLDSLSGARDLTIQQIHAYNGPGLK